MKRHALLLAGSVLLASAAAAAAPLGVPSAGPTPAASPAWLRAEKPVKAVLATKRGPSPLRIGGMLLLVATLGGVAFYAKRRRQVVRGAGPKAGLRVVGTTRVGAKASAVIVEISGKRLLLGVTDQAVSTLAWLDDEPNAAVEEPREDSRVGKRPGARPGPVDDVTAAGPSGFLRLLRNAVGTGAFVPAIPADEVAKGTRDELRLSHRETEDELPVEGQVMGLAKRRRESP